MACVWIDTGRAGKLIRDERYTGSGVKDSDKDVTTGGEFVQRQAWQEQDALHRLARWANRFSPLVGIVGARERGASDGVQWKQELQKKLRKQKGKHQRHHYAHPVDARLDAWKTEAIWIDITDVRRFFGSEEKLAFRICEEFREELKRNYRRVDLDSGNETVAFRQQDQNPRTVKATSGRQEGSQGLVVRVAVAGTVGASWAACLTLREGIRLLPLIESPCGKF